MIALQFKPPLLGILATVLAVSLLVSLGQWQLNRADQKNDMLAQFEDSLNRQAVLLPNPDTVDDLESWRYRKVYFEGAPLPDKQFLLDNQVRNKRAGFNALTIFKTVDGQHLLVDRGWLPLGKTRDLMPDLAIAPQLMRVDGYIYVPYGEPFKAGEEPEQSVWPRIIAYLDFAAISAQSQLDLAPLVIRMHPDSPDGYLREWPLAALSPDKHIGYAVQWFALAATAFGIFVLLSVKRKSNA